MKFIDKSKSDEERNRLHTWRDGYRYNGQHFTQYQGMGLNQLCQQAEFTGKKLFNLIPKRQKDTLREDLRKEQDYLCCYCCQKLDLNKLESKSKGEDSEPIEHFLDKGTHPCLTFEYDNLFLACRGNQKPIIYVFTRNDNWVSIANHFNVNESDLMNKNPNLSFIHGQQVEIKLPQHCDVAKAHLPIPINPTEPNCWKRFRYDSNGNIMPIEGDIDAEKTIRVLKLDTTTLNKERKKAWEAAKDSYDRTNIKELLEEGKYQEYRREVEKLKIESSKEAYCPLYWYFYENPS